MAIVGKKISFNLLLIVLFKNKNNIKIITSIKDDLSPVKKIIKNENNIIR